MSPVLLLLLQASVAPGGEVTPRDFDLKDVAEAERLKIGIDARCRVANPSEILVCGRRDPDRYRYREPEGRPEYQENGVPRAEMGLGNGATGGVELEQVGNPDGTVSKRIMVRVNTKF